MDFLVVAPESPEIASAPCFDRTVAETGARAAEAVARELGARLLGPEEAPSALDDAAGSRSARAVLWPGGLVTPAAGAIRGLLDRLGDAPLRLDSPCGQIVAVAAAATVLREALRPTFDETLAAMAPAPALDRVEPGFVRIADAASWSRAVGQAREKVARSLISGGALVEDPRTLWADPGSTAGPGARIGVSVRLSGNTSIGAGAEIGSFCRIENCEIGPGAKILSHSVLLDSTIGRDARVGPFAHIRPNTRLEPGAFAGSFVETKNAVLGRHAALPHLSYLGDAEVGPRSNLGAGTITCNYDGRGKHRTVIGAGAFVGSNAILIAPVAIGKRAFVAAGSVIVDDVPEGALAIARGRQSVKPGRAAGRFEGASQV